MIFKTFLKFQTQDLKPVKESLVFKNHQKKFLKNISKKSNKMSKNKNCLKELYNESSKTINTSKLS